MERLLYEASVEGDSTVLQMLLQKDPLILDKVTLNRYDDMPLHVASMLGHVDFINEILTQKPKLSMECDSRKRLPLHIASAKGHVDIVKVLVLANPDACSTRDCDGRNPLHLAAMKGHCEVVKELVRAQPHVARAMVQQETILHLCVKHSQLEVLKLLIETVGDHEFVNTKDADGNSLLHLAVADKQIEIINFLLLNTTIEVNASNNNGETLIDILAQGPKDVKDQQIIRALARAGVVEAENESLFRRIPINSRSKMGSSSDLKNNDLLDKKIDIMMLVASFISAIAFQAGISPPSGVWQDDKPTHKAGYAIMERNHPELYNIFIVCNTVGFVSTLSIVLLLISGLPFLKNRVFLWILLVIMWIGTASMSCTYVASIWALTPKPESVAFAFVVLGIVLVWFALATLLVVGHTIRLIKKIRK